MSLPLASSLVLLLSSSVAAQTVSHASDSPPPVDASAGSDEGRRDYAQISLEELLNKDISVAATKTRIDVAKAPVSVTVITPEDIRRTGANRLGDVLRTVPGLDVLESFPGQISVSARGTSEVFNNNMLVLVDGRRLEFQSSGVPYFENMPVRLEDIKRIEVIKGPVGALYGTNALAGIISITTYAPDEVPGTLVAMQAGDRDTYATTLRHAGRIGESAWWYKLVGGYNYTSTWATLAGTETGPSPALRKGDVVGMLERQFADGARLGLEAGLTKGDLAALSIVTTQNRFVTWPHFRASYSRPDFHAQLTANPQSSELKERTGPVQPIKDRSHAMNLSVDRTLHPFASSTLTLGGNARFQRSTQNNLGTAHNQTVWGVFAQDEQVLVADRLSFVGALGLSGHPEIPTQVDGNAALVATVVEGHTLRVSAGRGHRDPSFTENYIDFARRIGTRDGYQTGNTDLEPESVKSLEAGYRGRFDVGSSTVRLFFEGFREDVDDLIGTVTTVVPAGTVPQFPTVTAVQKFQNLENRKGRGFETGVDWSRSPLQLSAHYAHQRFENASTGVGILKDTPRHKVYASFYFTRGWAEIGTWTQWVSHTLKDEGYVLVSPRVSARLRGWELSVQAFNVLEDEHVETANERGLDAETIGRSVSFRVSRSFGGR
ncbi:MAG: TonB-dependent receptor [Vicinamibacteria bacterium]